MSSVFSAMAGSIKAGRLRETMDASVFGESDEHTDALCQPVLRLGLYFGDHSPRAWMMGVLQDHGFTHPQALQSELDLPKIPLLVRPWHLRPSESQPCEALPSEDQPGKHHPQQFLDVVSADPQAVLWQAVCLGLCSRHRYDPSRPVIWTNSSLSRGLLCYSVGGFYQ